MTSSRSVRRLCRPTNSSVWQEYSYWTPIGLLVLILLGNPPTSHGRDWIAAGQSGYSSTYHTQSWYDSLQIVASGLLGNTWHLGQRLDLLRKELSSGLDLQQRHHRIFLAAEPTNRTSGWTLNLDADENSIVESVDRRTLKSRVLLGGVWRHGRSASVGLQVGGIASRHRAGGRTADDQGFAERLTAAWELSPPKGGERNHLGARARLTHEGDQRTRLSSNQTEWAWDMEWQQSDDTLALEWSEQWRDTRFYPVPDEFDRIGRQKHRYRIGRVKWSHISPQTGTSWLPPIINGVSWSIQAAAGLDRNTYALARGSDATGMLPGDVNTTHRTYEMGASRRLSHVLLDIRYRYRWSEDNFSERRRNQTAETGELDGRLLWRLTATDSVGVHSVFRVASYSVPGEASFFNDRDQGERVVEMFWRHRFSEVLSVRPVFSFRGFRQVFLSEELSANNNTDNIYLLAPAIDWTPFPTVAVSQRFGIRAHYRFFDFERSDPGGRGTLYRRAESVTGVRVGGMSGTAWELHYTYRYEDFGGLFDRDGWVQAVDWDRRSHLVGGQLHWRPSRRLAIRPALGLERKKSFNHRRLTDGVRRIEDEPFRRTNISITAEWNSRAGYAVRLVIARRVQQFGEGSRDRDDRWELTINKGM